MSREKQACALFVTYYSKTIESNIRHANEFYPSAIL